MDSHQFWFLLGLLLVLAILFAGFFALLWFRRPKGLINRLPDDILLLIFAQLPLTDLLTVPFTCHRWHALFPVATHARRDLFLQNPASWFLFHRLRCYYPCPIAGAPSAESALLYENLTDEPRLSGHLTSLLQIHLIPNKSDSQRSFHLPSLVPELPELFPNINRLYIAIAGPTETLNPLLRLLTAWAPHLTTLYLSFREKKEPDAAPLPREDTRRLFTQLQTVINSMSNLKHLLFSVLLSSFSGPIDLHLPIIAQLETFYCHTRHLTSLHDVDLPLTELQHQLELALAEPSPCISLKEVALYNWSTLEQLQLTPSFLTKAFVRLGVFEVIDETNLPIFANLSTQWPLLRSLTIQTTLPLSRFLSLLRPLTHLVHLFVYLHSQTDEQQPAGEPPIQLESIKHLRLYHVLTSHQALLEHVRSLGRHLPSLAVACLVNQSVQCTDCQYDRERGDVFNGDIAARCDAHSVHYLMRVFPHLGTILYPARVNWREWKADRVVIVTQFMRFCFVSVFSVTKLILSIQVQ